MARGGSPALLLPPRSCLLRPDQAGMRVRHGRHRGSPEKPQEQPQTLDELMIAMDVVDTLRHREDSRAPRAGRGGAGDRADCAPEEDLPRAGDRGSRPCARRRGQGPEGEPLRLHPAAAGLETVAADGLGTARRLRQTGGHRCRRARGRPWRLLSPRGQTGQACRAAGAHRADRNAPQGAEASPRQHRRRRDRPCRQTEGRRAARRRGEGDPRRQSCGRVQSQRRPIGSGGGPDARVHAHHRLAPGRNHRRVAPAARQEPGAQLLSDR